MKHEKGIPVRRYRYPLDTLEVTECLTFDVPAGKTLLGFANNLRCMARRFRKSHGTDFTVRTITKGKKTLIRVWRIK